MSMKKHVRRTGLFAAIMAAVGVSLAFVAVPVVSVSPEEAPSQTYTQYNDGTTKAMTHEFVDIRWEPAVVEEVTYEEPVVEESSYDVEAPVEDYSDSFSYPSGSGVLTREGGVNYFNGYRETWYSEHELAGGGLNIPGRHVAEDGTIRDADGNVCVASSDLPYGAEVETSLGHGKVYDSGCASGTIDIYTSW